MLTKPTKQPRDERLQLIYYKAGYYAFLVSFPLMFVTFLLFAFDGTRESVVTPIMVLISFWAGLGTFTGYMMKQKAALSEREILWQNSTRARKHRTLRLVTFPLVISIFVLFDYLGTIYLEQEKYVWTTIMVSIL